MSNNTDLTPSLISKETLLMLANNTVAAGKVNRKFENQFVKVGSTLTIRKPNRFKVTSGRYQISDVRRLRHHALFRFDAGIIQPCIPGGGQGRGSAC